MTEICRVQRVARRMRTPVHVDLAPDMRRAFEDHDHALLLGQLDDLGRIGRGHHARTTRRQTIAFGIVLGLIDGVVVVDRCGPRLEWHPRLALRAAASSTRRAFTTAERRAAAGTSSTATTAPLRLRRERLPVVVDNARAHIRDVGNVPDALLAGDASEVDGAVGETRRWLG